MRIHTFFLFITALLPLVLVGCAVSNKDFVHVDNRPQTASRTIEGIHYTAPDPNYADARELKLKVRELTEQLVADMQDCSLQGSVVLPTSFVNLDDFNETSAFGRLIGEQLFYELNQRGYPVREYRMSGNIQPREKAGEFALSRELGKISAQSVIVGTYAWANNAVFVNARLVHPGNGKVIRTANLVIESNPTIESMLGNKARNNKATGGTTVADGTMNIRDFDTVMNPPPSQNLTIIDIGKDIH
jgi:TolB-like protein